MSSQISKLARYVVEGGTGLLTGSKLGQYVVEGTQQRIIVAKLASYIVEGPPVIITAAPRRRPLIMP